MRLLTLCFRTSSCRTVLPMLLKKMAGEKLIWFLKWLRSSRILDSVTWFFFSFYTFSPPNKPLCTPFSYCCLAWFFVKAFWQLVLFWGKTSLPGSLNMQFPFLSISLRQAQLQLLAALIDGADSCHLSPIEPCTKWILITWLTGMPFEPSGAKRLMLSASEGKSYFTFLIPWKGNLKQCTLGFHFTLKYPFTCHSVLGHVGKMLGSF